MEEITNAEWEVMRVIWTLKQATSQEVITNLNQYNWQPATIKTLIGRLVKKGCLAVRRQKRPYVYYPLVAENEAMDQAATNLFSHLCNMKKGHTLLTLIKATTLSQSDIVKLQTLLKQKALSAPQKVACDCLKGEIRA
ncbi:CopY/TcrY family copper transport repressor [Bombilactobacillus mellis]|uniref:CopY/TcrY family copper transport repressor n=1 Tax=Bombilactobacillus mellis TaxID=1218508 RepID=UPI00158003E5|nr:CopY/TcrY family copper transport repressor [Bombilactobacillus mellis]NUF25256.1 CopY/TcrY family copper transport repressor [Bombilactobacillus mellis]